MNSEYDNTKVCIGTAIRFLRQKRRENQKASPDYDRIAALNSLQRSEEQFCGARAMDYMDEYSGEHDTTFFTEVGEE